MVLKTVLDTNAVLYLLGGRLAEDLPEGEYCVSVITEMELLSYPPLDASDSVKIRDFLADVQVVPLTDEIKQLAIELRRKHGLRLPDAIVTATAMHLEAPLVTNDAKLLKVPGLSTQAVKLKESEADSP